MVHDVSTFINLGSSSRIATTISVSDSETGLRSLRRHIPERVMVFRDELAISGSSFSLRAHISQRAELQRSSSIALIIRRRTPSACSSSTVPSSIDYHLYNARLGISHSNQEVRIMGVRLVCAQPPCAHYPIGHSHSHEAESSPNVDLACFYFPRRICCMISSRGL